jgi:hypothetical protein
MTIRKRPNHVKRSLGKVFTRRLRKSYYREYQQARQATRPLGHWSAAAIDAADARDE